MAGRVTRELALGLGEALRSRGLSVAVAESCTGGLVCAAITEAPGSSVYFLGGVVAYDNEAKVRDLGVPKRSIASQGAVSAEVALAMADGVRRRFGADVGVGTTGIAGPSGGTPEKPAGTVYVGISVRKVRRSHLLRLDGDRESVRRQTVEFVLSELARVVGGEPVTGR